MKYHVYGIVSHHYHTFAGYAIAFDLKESEYLYIEGYLVTSDISREAAIAARQF